MAAITYQVIRKPIEQRLIDAACIFWDVEREYFITTQKKCTQTVAHRKKILMYLIKFNTQLTGLEIAKILGYSTHSILDYAISEIEASMKISREVSNEINQIKYLADKLDAEFVTTNTILVNNQLVK